MTTMKRIWLGLLLSLFAFTANAQTGANVVTSCGTLPQQYSLGGPRPIVQDINGNLCTNGAVSISGLTVSNVTISGTVSTSPIANTPVVQPTASLLNVTEASAASILSAVQGAIPAGSNFIGSVGVSNTSSQAITVSDTPTVSTSAYSAGNCLGGWRSVTIANSNGQTGFLLNVIAESISSLTPTLTLYAMGSSPTTSKCVDKSAFTLTAADVPKLIAAPQNLTLAQVSTGISSSFAEATFTPPRAFIAGNSVKLLWYALATTAITPTTTSEFILNFGAALN